jgi:hypothetical protein
MHFHVAAPYCSPSAGEEHAEENADEDRHGLHPTPKGRLIFLLFHDDSASRG